MSEAGPSQRELFEQALALAPARRAAWLDAHCADPALRNSVERMLTADRDGESRLLARPYDELLDRVGENENDSPPSGTRIGPFTLLDKLGEGGSSVVFRAEREQAGVLQQVAVKLLRRGLHTADERRRFRDERRALAQLQHPGIARLIEGGISDTGLPYIALELVEGVSIVEHARTSSLELRDRLRLFIDVCRAVESAHRALIVHRDLKPSNILVTPTGEVKLLDFGIAKLLDADVDDDDTQTHHAPMTPAYAAPEQFAHEPITTATDVYSLGIVLGELITGQRRESGDSRTPSARVDDDTANAAHLFPTRQLRRKLRGDLDNIVLRATAEEPERRYASAGAFADDITRHLSGQPVAAHPPSRLYRARKFVGRHRGGVVTTILLLAAILAALGLALWQADVARGEAQRANSVRDFLLRVFSAAEPAGPRLAPPSVVDVVRISIAEAQRSPTLYPRVRVELLGALGNVLRTEGEVDESLRILDTNYKDATTRFGTTDVTALDAGLALARAFVDAGKRPEARALFDRLLVDDVRADADLRSRVLAASALLAVDRFEKERALKESTAAVSECAGDACTEPTRINALLARGYVLAGFQQDESAIPILEAALKAQRALYGGPHIDIADNEQGLSRAYRRLGLFDRAEALARDSLAIVEASVPDPHVRRTDAFDTLRQVLIDTRRFDEAETLGERIIAMDKATLGPEHPGVATSENTLGFTYMMDSKFDQAIEHYRAALELSEKIPDNQRRTAIYRSNLGVSIGRNGSAADGEKMIRTAIGTLRGLPEPNHDQICSALEKLGTLQLFSGDAGAATKTFSESVQIYNEKLADAPKAWRAVSLNGLGRSLLQIGEDSRAAEAFNETLVNETTPKEQVSPVRIEARAGLAAILHRRGDDAAARVLIGQAQAECANAQGRLSPTLQAFVDTVAATMVKR